MSSVTIQLPDSLHGKLHELAKAQGTSVEQLISVAVGEKLTEMMEGTAHSMLEGALGTRADFEASLESVPNVTPDSNDSLE